MDIQEIIEWFKAAKPKPTTDDIAKADGYFKPDLAKFLNSNKEL